MSTETIDGSHGDHVLSLRRPTSYQHGQGNETGGQIGPSAFELPGSELGIAFLGSVTDPWMGMNPR